MKSNGFLDNLPDLGIGDDKVKHKKKKISSTTKGVIWRVIHCPSCRSDKTRVTTTKRPIRYHKCDECGHRFKSVEV